LTSFLIGLVVAYQSAYQLKIYGANIFVVDMLGISILRELAPLITAIVIAGRSGSAFTAQIGAMKITEELDAMRTMGFDPYIFLVMPRILALMVALPLLIFVADIIGIVGGMVVANIDLGISSSLFLDRFSEVVSAKHFLIGLAKGPFFCLFDSFYRDL
jgi:phospholipid/cholesterol/gamma-HCH transport system permease protein